MTRTEEEDNEYLHLSSYGGMRKKKYSTQPILTHLDIENETRYKFMYNISIHMWRCFCFK